MRTWSFLAPIVGGLVWWLEASYFAGVAGLVFAELLLLALWPALVPAVRFGIPYGLALLVPRTWRADYRNRRDRYGRLKKERREQAASRITDRTRFIVYAADRNLCVGCGLPAHTPERLGPVDHRIPYSWGGLTLLPNLFLLCEPCNLVKMTFWVDRAGVAHGRSAAPERARDIFYAERRARWNPARWWRVAWWA